MFLRTPSYYNEVNALAQYGITAGCGTDLFCPTANVTRDEMAIFIVRSVYGSDNFTYLQPNAAFLPDVTPSTFGFKWIQKLKGSRNHRRLQSNNLLPDFSGNTRSDGGVHYSRPIGGVYRGVTSGVYLFLYALFHRC